MPRTGVRGENSAARAATSACRSTAPADHADRASIARYSRSIRFAGVANTNITELYSRNATAPSQVSTAAAEPRAAISMELASTGTPASSTTSAVPRADPFITAVPRSADGSRNVSSEDAAAVMASAVESQYARPRDAITRFAAPPVVPIVTCASAVAAMIITPFAAVRSCAQPSGPGAEWRGELLAAAPSWSSAARTPAAKVARSGTASSSPTMTRFSWPA